MKQPPQGTFAGAYIWADTSKNIRFEATGEFRAPKKGEWFLSGAIVTAYKAENDGIKIEYWIAVPVMLAPCSHCNGSGKVVVRGDSSTEVHSTTGISGEPAALRGHK